jgi:hypothetical protein
VAEADVEMEVDGVDASVLGGAELVRQQEAEQIMIAPNHVPPRRAFTSRSRCPPP